MKKTLMESFEADMQTIESLEKRAQKSVDEAVEFAASSPEPEPSELFEDIFCKRCGNVVS